ncbi:zinc finger protein GLIS1 [Phthorimaea operculella]|nr:zinc finger protein GLIS1 [Phthorimaea operculella]
MTDYDAMPYADIFQEKTENVSDLHAYYMSQFNLELENGKKRDSFKYGNEESFNFEVLDWNTSNNTDFEIIDQVIDSNINEQNIKEVLLDLDNIDFDDKSLKTDSSKSTNTFNENIYENNEFIDDESLIDEICREDNESRLTPEGFSEEYILPHEKILPSIETAFSKRYCNYSSIEETQQISYNAIQNTQTISSIEHYSYPNNLLHNLDSTKNQENTTTSCTEFNYDRRKVSVSESIESDLQSSSYYDENSETFEEDELFINLDDFGLSMEKDDQIPESSAPVNSQYDRRAEKEKVQGERICLWEHCYERYPNQSTLVEHIERCHVNTYKGDEFSCLWRDCTRAKRPFNARYKLLIHMRVHSGHKPNRCHHPGCGKAFSRLENLKIHVRSHTGERPYACLAPHCRKAFSNSSDRAKHQRTHFNARPYACGAAGCGKRYTDPSSLRKHVKTHPHITNVPRTCIPPTRPMRRVEEQMVPSSPAKLATLRCIRDKLTVPRLQRI